MKIKFCGITNLPDAAYAIELGVNYLGFIVDVKTSKRAINITDFVRIIKELKKNKVLNVTKVVLVLKDPSINQIKSYLEYSKYFDVIQLHGKEAIDFCKLVKTISDKELWKAFRVSNKSNDEDKKIIENYLSSVDMIILDKKINEDQFSAIELFKSFGKQAVLAGGINSENIVYFTDLLNPSIVDLSSGIEETPKKKSRFKMKQFIEVTNKL